MNVVEQEADLRQALTDNPANAIYCFVLADWLEEQARSEEAAACRDNLPVSAELADYDWAEAFGYAGEPDTNGSPNISTAKPGENVSIAPFGRRHVRRVHVKSEGEYDGYSWLCVGELWDGRFFALKAGCDYTGWS